MFSTSSKNFLPFSSNLKLSTADTVSLEKSKICHVGKAEKRHIHVCKFWEDGDHLENLGIKVQRKTRVRENPAFVCR